MKIKKLNEDVLVEAPGSLSGNKLKIFKELTDAGWDNEAASDAVRNDKFYQKVLQAKKDGKDLGQDLEKEVKAEKETDEYNADGIEGEDANRFSLGETEKAFNSSRFKSDKKYRQAALTNLARNYSDNMGLKTAAKTLLDYKPEFIKSWADSFNWAAVGDKNEPFVQALNNPGVNTALAKSEDRWVKLYNILYDADDDVASYAAQTDAVICNPNLYKLKNNNEAKQIVKIDIADKGEHRKGFNKKLDTNNHGEILNFGKKIGVQDDSSRLVNTIKNNSKNLSREEKIKAAKALGLDKKDLDTLSKDLDNAANN